MRYCITRIVIVNELVTPKKVTGIDLLFYIIQNRIISVCDYASTHLLELSDGELTAEETAS